MKTRLPLVGLSAMLLVQACKKEEGEKEEAARFLATTPVVIDTSYEKQYVAQIRSVRNIEIRPQEKDFL